MTIEEIQKQIEASLVRARDIAAVAEKESREFTAEERVNIKAAIDGVTAGRAQLKTAADDASIRRQITDLSDQYKSEPTTTPGGAPAATQRRGSAGHRFVSDPGVEAWMKSVRLADGTGAVTTGTLPDSPRVVLNDLIRLGGSDSGGELVVPEQTGIVVPVPRMPLTIEQLITVGSTSSDSVEYVAVLSETNNAAMVPESTSQTDAVGVKPESAMTFERRTATVETIAHWVPATRKALADVGQLRTIIDSFLRDGLLQKLETEIIAGPGTAGHFAGLIGAAGLSQAFSTDIFETTRKARTKLRTNGRVVPNAWLMNPLDMETIELTQNNEADYYGGGPFATPANLPLWRVPVVEHESVTQGLALLGDFKRAVLWRKSDAQVMVSDSHADFFIRNLIAVLAEMEAAFALVYPDAVISVDLTA